MSDKRENQVSVRLTDEELAELDRKVEEHRKLRPGIDITRADLLRQGMSYIPKAKA